MQTLTLLFIVYLLHVLVLSFDSFDKNLIYKHQLRGLIEKERNREIEQIISGEYNKIHSLVLEQAMIGNFQLQFNILCFDVQENISEPTTLRIIKMYKIPLDPLVSKIIDKLKASFPDSNFIQETNDGNKCHEYRLSW
jgi:hypothetical protein